MDRPTRAHRPYCRLLQSGGGLNSTGSAFVDGEARERKGNEGAFQGSEKAEPEGRMSWGW